MLLTLNLDFCQDLPAPVHLLSLIDWRPIVDVPAGDAGQDGFAVDTDADRHLPTSSLSSATLGVALPLCN